MNSKKRLRPLMSVGELFRMPQVILIPAFLFSCALIPFSIFAEGIPTSTIVGAFGATFVFFVITFLIVILPILYALLLSQSSIEEKASILRKEKRARTLMMPDYKMRTKDRVVTFEFTPQGSSEPIRLEAEVGSIYSKLSEGKTAKIKYAKANPRIVKFIDE